MFAPPLSSDLELLCLARPPSRGAVPGRPFRRRRGRLGASSSDPPTTGGLEESTTCHKAQRQIGAWHTRCLVPRLCASCRVRPSAAPIIQRAHKQPWAARGSASSPAPSRAPTTSSSARRTPVPKPPPTPLPMRPTTSCRPCASAARDLWRRRRRASRRRPCPTTATGRRSIAGLVSSPTRGGAPTATNPSSRRRIDCRWIGWRRC